MSSMNFDLPAGRQVEKLLDLSAEQAGGVEVEWKPLGEVSNVLRGKRLTKNLLSESEKFPVFHGGLNPLGFYGQGNRPANTVMIINVGASAGTVGCWRALKVD